MTVCSKDVWTVKISGLHAPISSTEESILLQDTQNCFGLHGGFYTPWSHEWALLALCFRILGVEWEDSLLRLWLTFRCLVVKAEWHLYHMKGYSKSRKRANGCTIDLELYVHEILSQKFAFSQPPFFALGLQCCLGSTKRTVQHWIGEPKAPADEGGVYKPLGKDLNGNTHTSRRRLAGFDIDFSWVWSLNKANQKLQISSITIFPLKNQKWYIRNFWSLEVTRMTKQIYQFWSNWMHLLCIQSTLSLPSSRRHVRAFKTWPTGDC